MMKKIRLSRYWIRAVSLLIILSFSICLASMLSSCKNSDPTDHESGSDSLTDAVTVTPKPKTEITIYTDKETYNHASYFANDFQTFYNKYKLNIVCIEDSESVNNRINTELASGKGPDLIMVSEKTNLDIPKLISTGALADLNTMTSKSDKLSLDIFDPDILKSGEFGGKQLLLPLFYTLPMITYVQEYVKDSNAELDGTFLEFAESLKGYKNVVFKNFPKLSDIYLYLGYDFIDYDSGKCGLNNPKTEEMINAYMALYSEIGTDPQKYLAPNGNYTIEANAGALVAEDVLFVNSSAGIGNVCNIDIIDDIDYDVGNKYLTAGVTALPGSFEGGKMSASCGWVVAVNAKTSQPDAVLSFIENITSFGNTAFWADLGITSYKAYNDCIKQLVYNEKLVLPDGIFEDEFQNDVSKRIPAELADSYYKYFDNVDLCTYLDMNIRKMIDGIVDSIVSGKTVSEALEQAESEINGYLGK